MDNITTILLYIGALLLIGIFKSIGKARKQKPAVINRTFSDIDEVKEEDFFDDNAIFDFLQENPVLQKIEAKPQKIKASSIILPLQNEEDKSVIKSSNTPIALAENEESFILGEFNLPAAIVYSEILKRPDY